MSLKGFDVLYAEGKEMETSHVVKEQSLFDTDEAHFHTEKAMNVVDSPFVEDSTSQKIVAQKSAKVFLVSSVKDKQMSSFRTSLLTSPRSFTENTTVFV